MHTANLVAIFRFLLVAATVCLGFGAQSAWGQIVFNPSPDSVVVNTAYPPFQYIFPTGGDSVPSSCNQPMTTSVTVGAPPPGMSLSSTGLLSGTPTAVGAFTFDFTAHNSSNCDGLSHVSLDHNGPPFSDHGVANELAQRDRRECLQPDHKRVWRLGNVHFVHGRERRAARRTRVVLRRSAVRHANDCRELFVHDSRD